MFLSGFDCKFNVVLENCLTFVKLKLRNIDQSIILYSPLKNKSNDKARSKESLSSSAAPSPLVALKDSSLPGKNIFFSLKNAFFP